MKNKLEKITGEKITDVIKLFGDASYRVYYRAFLQKGGTVVAMQLPVGIASASEEITNFKGEQKEPPFINVTNYLSSIGIRVPKVLNYSKDERIIILQDLGDELFIKKVTGASEGEKKEYYKRAVGLLKDLQAKAAKKPDADCVALKRSFDATLLNWEFDHFREYFIEARLGVKLTDEEKRIFESFTRKVTEKILQMPKCFTHRDFQSKNIMIDESGEFWLIDYQDALMGPYLYDLVALLRDSYVELPWEDVEEMVCHSEGGNRPKNPKSPLTPLCKGGNGGDLTGSFVGTQDDKVMTDFNLMTLQRKMKDAGRFVYIEKVKKNPNFLQYIPTTIGYVKNALMLVKSEFEAGEYDGFVRMMNKYL